MFDYSLKIFKEQLIEKIGSNHRELFLPIKEEKYAKPGNCFLNVQQKVKNDGGSIIYGWSVLNGDFLMEAERHAIWKSPNDELVDITPSTQNLDFTFFIPQELNYIGQFIDNVRINKTKNEVVDHWIIISSLRSKIFNTASRKGDYIEIPKHMQTLYYRYENLNNCYYSFLIYGGGTATNCFCNSSKPYNRCHSLTIRKDCERDGKRIDYLQKKYAPK
jgi:hypothetical protein